MRILISGGGEMEAARVTAALASGGFVIAAPDAPFDLRLTLGDTLPRRLRIADVTLDFALRRAVRAGRVIPLTPTEFGLLGFLARAARPVGRRELIREVWGYAFDPGTNLVAVHVSRLRAKLGRGIVVRDGDGYRLPQPCTAG